MYGRAVEFSQISALYHITRLASEMRNAERNISEPKAGQLR